MIRTSRANNPPRAAGGFALIEMVVALAVVALVVALVLPRVAREPGPGALEAKAYEIASIFRDDRNAAMLGRREVVSRIDMTNKVASSGSRDRAVKVPDSVGIELVQAQTEAFPGGGGIRFYPDGRASGGVVTLHRGRYGYRVSVNWLTAHVDVEPVTAVARR
ncbi:GspH/FimT family pseudopilin [Microbaculum marinisediminis]|uniref:Prepilin-type N-terminal cleavage/methylation domain-containing protein n=1 Tax=Microbaculum marinisediminis TaxID=2931392 RepID=A0AAW5R3C2_9HYPH|nr:GspH/FimT family pseudopilin [Microbaculum sp. A6E488]MCT8974717.1 prepilin-type N-terminal cleavage/methylation domain-containing protein [Microbaculum sp. A6E488]